MRKPAVKFNHFSLHLFLFLFLFFTGDSAAAETGSGGRNTPVQLNKPYLVLISIDGFRWDYPDLYPTSAINSIAERGLKAEAMQPAFPTLTFPNHYSIATGMLPAHHGLVANIFPGETAGSWYNYKNRTTVQDGNWYLAEPIWVTAEKQGMVTAAYFFVGTEADVQGIRPTHWREFDQSHSGDQRIRQVLRWLAKPAETRPHLVTLYFEEVDVYTHRHGPGSKESIESISRVDEQIGHLLDGIKSLPFAEDVYIVLLSDHGQGRYESQNAVFVLDRHVNLDSARIVDGGSYVFIHFESDDATRAVKTRDSINRLWGCGRAMLPENAPRSWMVKDSARFPDIIVQADPGCAVISTASKSYKVTPGVHGWPPEMPEMRGIFMVSGPGIPAGSKTGVVHVTDIFPLMVKILGLDHPGSIDGDPGRLADLLDLQFE